MSTLPPQPKDSTPILALAHRAETTLESLAKVEEQIASLLEQKHRLLDEVRSLQGLVNVEFDRVLKTSKPIAAKLVGQIERAAPQMPQVTTLRIPAIVPPVTRTVAQAAS